MIIKVYDDIIGIIGQYLMINIDYLAKKVLNGVPKSSFDHYSNWI